jgi:long-chain acyl-CoA synthetase
MNVHHFNFYNLVCQNATTFTNEIAWLISESNTDISFADFKNTTHCLAQGLQLQGIQKGDGIGIIGKNYFEFFVIYGAAAAIGAVVVPINFRLSKNEICDNINDASPKILFVDNEFQHLINDIKDRLKGIDYYYNLVPNEGNYSEFSNLIADAQTFEPASVSGNDPFLIIHTAAIDGKARGAVLTHENMLLSALQLSQIMTLSQNDVHLNILPFFHVGGLMIAISAFMCGARNIVMKKFDAKEASAIIEKNGVSLLFDFSPILSGILDAAQNQENNLKSLTKIIGLETPETIERYQDTTNGCFYTIFGQTETSGLVTSGKYNDCPGAAGKVVPLSEVCIVDDNDAPIQVGQTGEILVRGPLVFREYINLPEETTHTFRNEWHHTGDLGQFDENGFLFYKGRKPEKELIKPGGENVYPAEVEKVILLHPNIKHTVVFGVPDPKWKEGIKAVCELHEGTSLTAQELIDFVGQHIARYKKPQYVEFATDIPKLRNGSPDRMAIKKRFYNERKQNFI